MPEATQVDVHGTPPSDEPPPCTRCYDDGHDAVWRFGQWHCPEQARMYMCEVCHLGTNDAYRTRSSNFVCDGCAEQPDALICSVDGCEASMVAPNSNFLPVSAGELYCREHQIRCRYCRNYGAERVTFDLAVCGNCRHRLPQTCHACEDPVVHHRRQGFYGDDVAGVCDNPDHDVECEYCGGVSTEDDLNTHGACERCQENSWRCEGCGETRYREDNYFHDGADYCGDCVRFCEGCGDYHPEPHCSQLINGWRYRPELRFHPGYEPNQLYIGFELECEHEHGSRMSVNHAAERVLDVAGGADNPYLYLKEDGSLMDGFEIVSHPVDPEWALKHGTPFPWDAIAEASEAGMRSFTQANCGLHMHLSRDAFGESHLWKFLQFHYRNPRALQAVALRSSVGYAKWNDERQLVMKYVKKESKNRDRYVAVNLQNDDTIELRYWKGTLKVESVQRAIKIAYGIYLYTKELTCKDVLEGGLKFGGFRKWATKEWPDLFDFMKERTADVQDAVQTRPAWPPQPGLGDWSEGDVGYLNLHSEHGRYGISPQAHGNQCTVVRVRPEYLDHPDIAHLEVRSDRGHWAVFPEMLQREPLSETIERSPGAACADCTACCPECREACEVGDCAGALVDNEYDGEPDDLELDF